MSLAVRHVQAWRKAAARGAEARARLVKQAQERALAASTPRLAKRISTAFVALEKSAVHGPEIKELKEVQYPLTYSSPEWLAFSKQMRDIILTEYIALAEEAFAAVEGQLGVTLEFSLNERIIPKGVIARRVTNVTDVTRQAINKTIRQGIDDGVHPSVIAKRMRDQLRGYAGLEDLTRSRAYTIARTETAFAFNLGAVAGYRQSGIVKQVRVIDSPTCGWTSHNSPDTANGKIVTLDQAAAHPISHPNCVRAFAPVAAGLEEKPQSPDDDLFANPKDFRDARYGNGTGAGEEFAHDIFAGMDQSKITGDMRRALQNYSGSGYGWMNDFLRNGGSVDDLSSLGINGHFIKDIMDYIALTETEAVNVYRGIGKGRAFGLNEYESLAARTARLDALVGTAHSDAGFMSVALNKDAAFSGVKLHLTVPKGSKALPVSSEALYSPSEVAYGSSNAKVMGESELLLPPGTKYVIESWEDADGNIILNGKVLP